MEFKLPKRVSAYRCPCDGNGKVDKGILEDIPNIRHLVSCLRRSPIVRELGQSSKLNAPSRARPACSSTFSPVDRPCLLTGGYTLGPKTGSLICPFRLLATGASRTDFRRHGRFSITH